MKEAFEAVTETVHWIRFHGFISINCENSHFKDLIINKMHNALAVCPGDDSFVNRSQTFEL